MLCEVDEPERVVTSGPMVISEVKRELVVIRFAGDSGYGMQLTGEPSRPRSAMTSRRSRTSRRRSGHLPGPCQPRPTVAAAPPPLPGGYQVLHQRHRDAVQGRGDAGPVRRHPERVLTCRPATTRSLPDGSLPELIRNPTVSESSERSRLSADDGWLDQLVDLHVLAECGDTTASATAAQWIASDPAARTTWQQVEQDCAQVRTGTSENDRPAVAG